MFFKVEKSGCGEHKGLVQIRYDLFLDTNDYKYSDFYIEVPIIPQEGYQGKVNEVGNPVDEEDYKKWLSSLHTEWINTPFCCHFVYLKPDITDEEIMFVGQCALDMNCKDHQDDNIGATKNVYENGTKNPVWNTALTTNSLARVDIIKATDFENIGTVEGKP